MYPKELEKTIIDYIQKEETKLYRLAFSYTKNKDDALDIIQDSIIKALKQSGNMKEPKYVKTWIYRIVVNTSIDFLRKNSKVVYIEDTSLAYTLNNSDSYQNFDLEKALDSLPSDMKTIIILRFFQDFKLSEISEILGLNINTVKTRLYKALDKMKIKLEDEIYE